MPTYQYVCTECGGELEAVQKFTDDPLTVHDACGGRLRKVFSPVGIVFKGSGFYRTDSRKSSTVSGSSGSAEKSSSESKAAAESKSSESKAEGKADSKSGSKKAAASDSASSAGSAGTKVA